MEQFWLNLLLWPIALTWLGFLVWLVMLANRAGSTN
jgi:hypothetical protein